MVSMVAFQAVDPGSIPGRRSFLFLVGSNVYVRFIYSKVSTHIYIGPWFLQGKINFSQNKRYFSRTGKNTFLFNDILFNNLYQQTLKFMRWPFN